MLRYNFLSFYKGESNEQSAKECYNAIEQALGDLGILTPLTLIGALATVRVECGRSFKPVVEIASGEVYEGRKDLGNTQVGDGVRFKGRGYIQLTGRDNYKTYGEKLGIDLVNNPDLTLQPEVSAKILALYFKNRAVNVACNNNDWLEVRKKINGVNRSTGLPNGWNEFESVVNQYLKKL